MHIYTFTFNSEANTVAHDTWIHTHTLFPHWQYIGPLWERINKGWYGTF